MTSSALKDPAQRSVRLWIRAFYVLSNLILAFLGKGGLAVSIICKMNMSGDLTLLDHYQSLNVYIFLTGSVVLILIGWLGILAGSRNDYNSTLVNGTLLGCFLVSITAYTVTTAVLTDYTQKGDLYLQMQKDMNNYNKKKDIVDKLHTQFSCCGLNDITTWNINEIPASCCRDIETKCILGSHLQTNGCFREFIRTSRYYAWLIFSVLISVALIEIFAIMLSSVQCRIIKDTQQKRHTKFNKYRIPRPQATSIHVENENENEKENEKENENAKENEKENEKKNEKENEKENEKANEKENEKEKEEENEKTIREMDGKEKMERKVENGKKEKEQDTVEKEKESAEENGKAESSGKKNDDEGTKQNTCRNTHTDVASAHKDTANIVVNIYSTR